MNIPPGWIVPDWPVSQRVRALITTRSGGASTGAYAGWNFGDHVGDEALAVSRNRDALRDFLPDDPVWLRQVHGSRVIEAGPGAVGQEADAAVAWHSGRVCAVLTADCVPVLLADADGSAVGIAHAGWRGLAAGVIENVVCVLGEGGIGCGSLTAYLGPGIGASAYQVGSDVFEAFVTADADAASAFVPRGPGKFLADLNKLARQRLERLGIRRIYGGTFCTYNDPERFYSFRRDGATGRMASLVWME